MRRQLALTIACAIASPAVAGPCEPATEGPENFFVSGVVDSVETVLVNPYSGDAVVYSESEALIPDRCYDGDGGSDNLLGSGFADVLFELDARVPSPLFVEVENFFLSDGNDILILANPVEPYVASPAESPDAFEVLAFAGSGNDIVWLDATRDLISGSIGNDHLDGGPGDDWVLGDEGNDTVLGGDGNDIVSGASGINTVSGGPGSDVISYNPDEGVTTIIEPPDGEIDVIETLIVLTPDDFTFYRRGDDLIIDVADGGKFIIEGQYSEPGRGVDELRYDEKQPPIDLRSVETILVGACPTDLDGDCMTGAGDLATLLAAWGADGADLDGDSVTGASDLAIMLAAWGGCLD